MAYTAPGGMPLGRLDQPARLASTAVGRSNRQRTQQGGLAAKLQTNTTD